MKLHSAILSPEQLERFKDAIEAHLEDHYQDHWFPTQPNKGSAYRCIRINQKMDPIIAKAGLKCGLDQKALRTIFPGELTLWIDPKEVSYRIGENGSICVLYEGAKDSNDDKAASSVNNKANAVKSQQQTNNHQSEPSRASPTDSSLSSTTSSLSSPSPSSSPDWCRPAGNTAGNDRRSSPISAFAGSHVVHNFHGHGPNGDLGLMNGQQASAYAFNHGVVNARNGHSGFGSNHYQSSNNTWGSPSRVESPSNWQYSGRRHHHGSSPHHQQHHNNHQQSGHVNSYNGWNESVANSGHGFGQFDHQRSNHITAHSGHMSLNANVEQMAAYVSS